MRNELNNLEPQPEDAGRWQGKLALVYRVQNGSTLVSHAFARAPFKVQRPFYPEGSAVCHSTVLHTAGGIVGGDRLSQNLHLHSQSHALVTTATAGRVYRSPDEFSEQVTQISLEAGSILEWLPQELIIFNGAQYRQQMRVDMAAGAHFFGWELHRMGRTAREERFERGQVRSQVEIWREGKPLWIDRQHLQGGEELIASPNGLARNAVIATAVYIGQPLTPNTRDRLRGDWESGNYRGQGGITSTLDGGLLARYRGPSTAEARAWFAEIWGILRPTYARREVVIPRVWQL